MEEKKEMTEETKTVEKDLKRAEKQEKQRNKKSIRPVIYLALIAVIMVSLATCIVALKTAKPKITSELIIARLETASELTSAKMICTGLEKYDDGNIPFLTQEAFSMIYSAEVRAGINLSEVSVDISAEKVTVMVPEITVQSINVNEGTIEFYDKKFALLKDDSKEDVIEAIKQAKKDIEKKPEIEELKTLAAGQIKMLFTSLLKDYVGDRELAIQITAAE